MTSNESGHQPALHIDLETYSDIDITKAGLYRYVESPAFCVLLAAYAWGDGQVQVADLTTEDGRLIFDTEIAPALMDPKIVKVAHNAAFERTALGKELGHYMPPEQWTDTMVLALMNGLPASLEDAGAALRLGAEDKAKLKTGRALIQYFCKPCRPTASNGGRTRNMPQDAPEKWNLFKEYCRRDVVAEQAIYQRLHRFPVTETEERIRCLDARINEGGVMIDRPLVESAIAVDDAFRKVYERELRNLTGLDNPNSVSQLKGWLDGAGLQVESLNKKALKDLRKDAGDSATKRALELREILGKTSVSKYDAMLRSVCKDGRIRGILQYYGAGRTGRWAGRLVQVQNLPQNHLDDIAAVRELVRKRDLISLDMLYRSVPDVLSQLIRTALIAPTGKKFLVADYHAIEAVCIAYLSQTKWRLDVFAGGGRIYEASYSQAFGVPIDSVKKGSPERQKGKIMELALGYGGGVNALKAFGADKLGLDDEELNELVTRWRAASPNIPRLWRECEDAAKRAIDNPGQPQKLRCGAYYIKMRDALRLRLPSGRFICYFDARIEDGGIVFMAQNQTTRKWTKTETWGGKLVENLIQSYARDILGEAMLRLAAKGYAIRFHVHDEIITEMPENYKWEDQAAIMGAPVSWAPGLDRYLHADGYETPFYMKD